MGRAWENVLDSAVHSRPASEFQLPNNLAKDPWLATVPPDTPIRSLAGHANSTVNFNHLVDELSNSLREGRLRPEQLTSGNLSVEGAVRHVAEINALRAKKAQEAIQAEMSGMPVHKDYPEQGYSWRQLKHEDEPTLQKWLTQEGDAMGHCVGGYCPDVMEGRSNIYSLRDAKGQPHVTIETAPFDYITALGENHGPTVDLYNKFGSALVGKLPEELGGPDTDAWMRAVGPYHEDILDKLGAHYVANPPRAPSIVQIKGKGNAKPAEQYLPFVQDFIRSGKWGDIGDAANTGLTPKEIQQLLKGQ